VRLLGSYWRLYRGLAPQGRRFLWLSAAIEYQYLGIYLIAVNLYLLRLGFGPQFIGVVTGSGIAAYSIAAFLAGYLFRGRSVCGLVIDGVLLIVAGLIGIAYTDLLPGGLQASWLLGANAIAWMGGGFFGVGRLPYLTAVAPREQRVHAFALERLMGLGLAVAGGLAVTVVPGLAARLFGTTLEDPAPYRVAILLAPAGVIPALLLFVRAFRRTSACPEVDDEETAVAPRSLRQLSPGTMILLLSAFTVLLNFAGTPPLYFFNVYLDEGLAVSPALIAFIMGVARLGSLPATFLLPALTRRWSLGYLLIVVAVALAIALVPLALIPHPVVAGLSFLTCSVLLAVYEPIFDLYRMEAVPSSLHTRMAGTTQTATYGAQSAAGFAGGYVVVSMGYPMLFLGATGLAFAAALLLGSALRRYSSNGHSPTGLEGLPAPSSSEA
jgi:MFS family permease